MTDLSLDLQAIAGIAIYIGLALPFSESIRKIRWRTVASAVAIQFAICLLLLRVPVISDGLGLLNEAVAALATASRQGTSFVFGYVGGSTPPFAVTQPASLAIFAFQGLAVILVVSAVASLLWHWRILPTIVRGISWVFQKTLGTSGPAGFAAVANVFVGMVEAPLLVRPYIARMTRHELLLLMTAGMSMIAGSMMVIYASMLSHQFANMPVQLMTKSLMSIPAAILFSHLMLPDDTVTSRSAEVTRTYTGTMDAITRGTADGLHIWLNVIAILVVLIALVALVNQGLALAPWVGGSPLSLERMSGWLFAPLAWLMGIPWEEAIAAGRLLGIKTVLNEFLAYLQLAAFDPSTLSNRTRLIVIYALCGFANFGSMGIQISGIAAMAPERRSDLNALAVRSLIGATLASCMTGAIVGIVAF